MFISASHAQAELANLVDQQGFDESDSDPKKADLARIGLQLPGRTMGKLHANLPTRPNCTPTFCMLGVLKKRKPQISGVFSQSFPKFVQILPVKRCV